MLGLVKRYDDPKPGNLPVTGPTRALYQVTTNLKCPNYLHIFNHLDKIDYQRTLKKYGKISSEEMLSFLKRNLYEIYFIPDKLKQFFACTFTPRLIKALEQ